MTNDERRRWWWWWCSEVFARIGRPMHIARYRVTASKTVWPGEEKRNPELSWVWFRFSIYYHRVLFWLVLEPGLGRCKLKTYFPHHQTTGCVFRRARVCVCERTSILIVFRKRHACGYISSTRQKLGEKRELWKMHHGNGAARVWVWAGCWLGVWFRMNEGITFR